MLGTEQIDIATLSEDLRIKIIALAVKLELLAAKNKITNLSTIYRGYIITVAAIDNVLDFRVFKVSGPTGKISKFVETHKKQTTPIQKATLMRSRKREKARTKTTVSSVKKHLGGGNPGPGKLIKDTKKVTD